jgi:hypothetical protein
MIEEILHSFIYLNKGISIKKYRKNNQNKANFIPKKDSVGFEPFDKVGPYNFE